MEPRVLAGRYELIAKLGEGGMGSVWRAQHLALGTPLAVKLIDPSMMDSVEAVGRFKREAQSAAALRSAHVIQVIDFGVDEGIPFIAMELLEGETLATRLERVYRISAASTARIITQVARALTRAHAAGIVHRDLKPANIFLVPEVDDDITKVLDFGIAKKLDLLTDSAGVKTRAGVILGSPYYMSPEQALGEPTIDHRTDIWSLGVIACQCLTGQRPFDRDTPGALLMAICSEPIPNPSSLTTVPVGFDAWFAHATARNPAERFASAAEAAAELREICGAADKAPPRPLSPLSDTTVSGRTDSLAPATTLAPAALAETAKPTSVPLLGNNHRQTRLAAFAIAGVISLTAAGVLLSRSVGQRVPMSLAHMAAGAEPIPDVSVPTIANNAAPTPTPLVPNEGSPSADLSTASSSASSVPPSPNARQAMHKLVGAHAPAINRVKRKSNAASPIFTRPEVGAPAATAAAKARDLSLEREVGF